MVVTVSYAVRKLVAARTRMSINRKLRNAGITGVILLILEWVIDGVVTCGACAAMGALGWLLSASHSAFSWAALHVFFLLPLLSGVTALSLGRGHTIQLDKLAHYPIAPLALFSAEALYAFADSAIVTVMGMQIAFAIGSLVGCGVEGWPVLLLLATGLTLQVGTHTLGTAAARLFLQSGRPKLSFLLMLVAMVSLFPLRQTLATHAPDFVGYIDAPPLDAALWLSVPLVAGAAMLLLAYRLFPRGPSALTEPKTSGPHELWSHRSPTLQVAHLHLVTLWATRSSRMAIVMPLLMLLYLIAIVHGIGVESGVDKVITPEQALELSTLMVWAMLPTTLAIFTLNLFGIDRRGVQRLLLLPVDASVLLYGKSLAMALVMLSQCVLTAVLMAALLPLSPASLATGVLLTLNMGALILMGGQWTSIFWPQPMAHNQMAPPPPLLGLLVMSAIPAGTWAAFAALLWFLGASGTWTLAAILLGSLAGVAVLYRVTTPLAARALARHHERLLKYLS